MFIFLPHLPLPPVALPHFLVRIPYKRVTSPIKTHFCLLRDYFFLKMAASSEKEDSLSTAIFQKGTFCSIFGGSSSGTLTKR